MKEAAQDRLRPLGTSRLEDYAHYRRGEAASVSPTVAEITGRPAIDVKQFAHDYAPAFTAQAQQRAGSS